MRNLFIYLSALNALSPVFGLRHGTAQLRDLLAYPKYEVQFLNDLPISTTDAEKARSIGIEREDEWFSLHLGIAGTKRLSNGTQPLSRSDYLRLIPMSLTPPSSTTPADYLCLMPEKNSTDSQTARNDLDEHVDLDPVTSWAALSHLDGKCLYSKQGWFTYSYCHNSHIRQFREARHTHPHPPGGYEPEEDPVFDGYTLGQAHQDHTPSPRRRTAQSLKGRKTISEPSSTSPSVSFAEGAASRYLVQRWSDGTTCDKTGQPREVEVQIHCSMTTTDVIYLVKEMAICQYVVIIHSPHLCALPGFRAPHADVEPAGIRCRQQITDEEFEKWVKGGDTAMGGKEALKLPWARPTGGSEGLQFAWEQPQIAAKDTVGTEDQGQGGDVTGLDEFEIEDEVLRKILAEAFEAHHAGSEEGEDEFMLLSLEEDDEGNIVLGTDMMGGKKGEKKLGGEEKELLLRAVRRFLEEKDGSKGGDRTATDDDGASDDHRVKDEL